MCMRGRHQFLRYLRWQPISISISLSPPASSRNHMGASGTEASISRGCRAHATAFGASSPSRLHPALSGFSASLPKPFRPKETTKEEKLAVASPTCFHMISLQGTKLAATASMLCAGLIGCHGLLVTKLFMNSHISTVMSFSDCPKFVMTVMMMVKDPKLQKRKQMVGTLEERREGQC